MGTRLIEPTWCLARYEPVVLEGLQPATLNHSPNTQLPLIMNILQWLTRRVVDECSRCGELSAESTQRD